ncbi:MAG TPA: hypothetical protein VJ576_13900 [Rhodocyclaceae bacterium]|nr:hypothetical protein [Rhodocyclaceae bacterium]
MTDKTGYRIPNLTYVEPTPAAESLAQFIRTARDLRVFGEDWKWSDAHWMGIGRFTKGAKLGSATRVVPPERLLHPNFIDFAKAVLCHLESRNPSASERKQDLQSLRLVELALGEEGADGDPTRITLHTLNRALQLAFEKMYAQGTCYNIGKTLERLARLLHREGLTRNIVRTFASPLKANLLSTKLGAEADRLRKERLPDERAIKAIGALFSEGFDLTDRNTNPDVFVTSCIAMLLSGAGSKRGGELFEMEIDAEHEETDHEGVLWYGWRWRSEKNEWNPNRMAWVHQLMEPYAREAFRRILTITEEPRRFAKYVEEQLELRAKNPNAPLRFYRHSGCPDVPDDQALTTIEAAAALGSKSKTYEAANSVLRAKGLLGRNGAYTLNTLWTWVLDHLPKGFPYVLSAKNKNLKYSRLLFCMHPYQLKRNGTPNPVGIWSPYLTILGSCFAFFDRHRANDEDGKPLKLKSHSIRHLIDTIAHDGTGHEFLEAAFVNAAAGRAAAWQGRTYDHTRAEDKAEIARNATQEEDGSNAVFDLPVRSLDIEETQTTHWTVRLRPRSCADINMHHRSATILTIWGGCEHDWLIKPCPHYRDCLNCKDHVCIKLMGKDNEERLERLRKVLVRIACQQTSAKEAIERGEIVPDDWLKDQSLRRQRVEELIFLLEDPNIPVGAEIRLSNTTENTHLHRVLMWKALEAVENKMGERDAIDLIVAAYRENRALPLHGAAPLLERGHGT